MFCSNCGKKIEDDSKFCEHCGCRIENDTKEETTIKRDEPISSSETPQKKPESLLSNIQKKPISFGIIILIFGILLMFSGILYSIFPSGGSKSANPKPSVETVELKDVSDSDDIVKVILQHDRIPKEYGKGFGVSRFDINNDGLTDILYSYSGISGSCGYGWDFLINKGGGKFVKSRFHLSCTGKKLDFSNKTYKGMRIPYFKGVEQKYYE